MTSPLAIILAGAGAAVGFFATGGIPVAVGLAAAAWAGRVAVAVPREPQTDRIDPFTLNEPWSREVQDAVAAGNRFAEAIHDTERGPLRDRMEEIGSRIEIGVREAWRIARQGQSLVEARRRIDTDDAQRQIDELGARSEEKWAAGSALQKTVESLRAQMASAQRLDQTIADARDRLQLTNARLDEAVARAAELSVQAGDVDDLAGLGDDVDALVTDLEALRLGLEEVDRPATGTA